jgi:hypothetical protein
MTRFETRPGGGAQSHWCAPEPSASAGSRKARSPHVREKCTEASSPWHARARWPRACSREGSPRPRSRRTRCILLHCASTSEGCIPGASICNLVSSASISPGTMSWPRASTVTIRAPGLDRRGRRLVVREGAILDAKSSRPGRPRPTVGARGYAWRRRRLARMGD